MLEQPLPALLRAIFRWCRIGFGLLWALRSSRANCSKTLKLLFTQRWKQWVPDHESASCIDPSSARIIPNLFFQFPINYNNSIKHHVLDLHTHMYTHSSKENQNDPCQFISTFFFFFHRVHWLVCGLSAYLKDICYWKPPSYVYN